MDINIDPLKEQEKTDVTQLAKPINTENPSTNLNLVIFYKYYSTYIELKARFVSNRTINIMNNWEFSIQNHEKTIFICIFRYYGVFSIFHNIL